MNVEDELAKASKAPGEKVKSQKTEADKVRAEETEHYAIPHVVATFAGEYLKSGTTGNEKVPFKVDCRVPIQWVEDHDQTPQGLFKNFYVNYTVGKEPGFAGLRTVHLVDISHLPDAEELSVGQKLRWTPHQRDLAKFAAKHAKSVRPELYPKADDLRHAITQCMEDKISFERNQERHAKSRAGRALGMNDVLHGLGY